MKLKLKFIMKLCYCIHFDSCYHYHHHHYYYYQSILDPNNEDDDETGDQHCGRVSDNSATEMK